MGFLKLFSKPAPTLARLPSGTFTVDRSGKVVVGTVSSSVPAATVEEIGRCVIATFREAQEANLPLSELTINYGSFKIIARDMRGGAMIFLTPINIIAPTN